MSKDGLTPENFDERYRLMVEGVRDYAIFMLDPGGYIKSWNRGAQRIKGYESAEIIGKHFSQFYPAQAIQAGIPDHELKVALREGRFEDEGWRIRKDGSAFWANAIITPLIDDNGVLRGYTKITRDLSDRRDREETLRRSEERFRLLVESVQDYAIFLLDPDGRISSWNAGAQRIKGYRAEEIIGQHFSVFYPAEKIASKWPEYELEVAKREGRFEDEGWRVGKAGTQFWANVIITALYDSTGRHTGFAKVTRDLSERRRLQALEETERKMNEFLAILAHELRNPLAPISNVVQLLLRKGGDEQVAWCSEILDRQVRQLTRLVDDLLDVSRIATGKISLLKDVLDLRTVIATALESSRPYIDSRRHQLHISLPEEPLEIEGDAVRLAQIFMNLFNNAAKFTPAGGHIWCEAQISDDRVIVRIRDTGVGIPTDQLSKVFELFRQGNPSLDRSESGLGIGLSLVERLARMHGGSVSVYSEGTDRGSEFSVSLPLAQRAVEKV